ncbi:VOC family protein [Solibacillus sp.]|uniref:VOC family protein n=1 Tax=Solibacillus sp. TaxID=1909654 RepID=UPI003314C7E8
MTNGFIHHIEINVSNLKKTVEFWTWFLEELGYNQFQKWDGGQSWRLAETYIVFVQTKQQNLDIPYHRGRVGLNHIAFHANSQQQVDHFTAQLEHKGLTILYKDRHPYAGGNNHYAVFFEDPDRIKVELVAPTTYSN